jgi:hypothetical protein
MKNLLKKLNEQCGKIYPGKKYEDLNEFDKLLVESTLEEFDVDRDRDEELYPIEFEGKLWYKEDCDEMFQMFSNVEVYESYRKYTNYYFSRQGITKLSQSQVFKGSEMLCASLSDPFEYSACLSMMKCKRFDPPYKGKYFFSFCPKVFFGGRLS